MVGFSSVRKVLETLSGRALGVALGAALADHGKSTENVNISKYMTGST